MILRNVSYMSCLRNYFFLFIIISFSDCLVKILFIKDLGLNLMTNKNYLSVMKIFENMKKIQGDCKTIYQYYDKKKTKTKITEKQIQYIKHKLVKLNKINKHWIGMIGKKKMCYDCDDTEINDNSSPSGFQQWAVSISHSHL